MQEQWGSDLEIVIRVLQTAIAPAFLLAAIASLLNVLTTRLARTVDRSRELQKHLADPTLANRQEMHAELRVVGKRKRIAHIAIMLSIAASVTICVMAGLLFLMGLTSFSAATLIISMFTVAMGLLACSLCALLWETGLAVHEVDSAQHGIDDADDTAGDQPGAAPADAS